MSANVHAWRNDSSPTLTRSIIGDFSVDGHRKFHHNRTNLNTITLDWPEGYSKAVRYDLNLAMERGNHRDIAAYLREWLTNMLEWLLHNKSYLSPPPHFVSARKTLRRIMLAVYESQDTVIYATKLRGTIYVCAGFSDDEIRSRDACSAQERRMSAWGHKFEHFMTDGSDPSTGMDENESYNCVYRAQLGAHTLIYKCEVDGIDSKLSKSSRLPSTHELVELKTHNIKFSCYGLNRYKLRDAWAQCTLAGIPRLVVGYRDDAGVVTEVKVLRVKDFPRLSNGFFTEDEMLSYLNAFLRWTSATVTLDDPNVVYELKISSRTFKSRRLAATDAPVVVVHPRYVQQIARR